MSAWILERRFGILKIGDSFYSKHDIIKSFLIAKGGGSAYGGKGKLSKPADEKVIDKLGEVKQSFAQKGDTILCRRLYLPIHLRRIDSKQSVILNGVCDVAEKLNLNGTAICIAALAASLPQQVKQRK